MPRRPSDIWREDVADEAAERAAGLSDETFMAELFPESLLADTDAALAANDQHGGSGYETGERELLCAYIDAALDETGVDIDALAARHRLNRWEITDQWRRW